MFDQDNGLNGFCKLEDDLLVLEHKDKLRHELAKGLTYEQACEKLADLDQDMKTKIADDVLKIIVSDLHLGKGYDVDDISLLLGIPLEKIQTILNNMLQIIGRELACHRQKFNMLTH